MSLVTRCPACQTTFKVVRDQLRISEGWVRCGRCGEVFDATLALTDSETGEPVPAEGIIVKLPAVSAEAAGTLHVDEVLADSPLLPSLSAFPSAPSAPAAQQGSGSVGASPFDDVDAGLQGFAESNPGGGGPDHPKPMAVNWPGAGLLELDAGGPSEVAWPSRAPAVPPESSVPAWRQIQAPPGLATVLSDTPRRARQDLAAPADSDEASASASLIDAAVNAQLQKELRRVRAEAFRDGLVAGPGVSAADAQPSSPVKDEHPADDAQSASVLLQASSDQAVAVGARVDESFVSPADAARRRIGRSTPRRPDEPEREDSSPAALPSFTVSGPAVLSPPKAVAASQGLGRGLLLGLLTVAAAVLLVFQYLRHERDTLAAANPALRPLVEGMCRHAGCEVGAPRRIDAVRIDGSSFTPDRSGERYQLMFTLRNAAPTPIAMPSIELSLLDANERPVIRRVFHPADFAAPARMAGRAEQPAHLDMAIQLPAEHSGPGVVGYSMLAFYP